MGDTVLELERQSDAGLCFAEPPCNILLRLKPESLALSQALNLILPTRLYTHILEVPPFQKPSSLTHHQHQKQTRL